MPVRLAAEVTVYPLRGRAELLDRLRSSTGAALLVWGPAGLGKSALLADLRAATDRRVVGVHGLRAERSQPLAALHRMLGPAVTDGAAALRSLVSRPTWCWVDDAQWMDAESLAALSFAARRLAGHPVGMVLTSRTPTELFDSTPLPPLTAAAADALLRDRGVPLGVRSQLVELGGGNPADLVALASALTPAQAAGREPVSPVLASRLPGYAADLAALPTGDRVRLLAVAADTGAPAVDPASVGGTTEGVSPATSATWYAAATPADRRAAHALLVSTTEGPNRSWHRAMASAAPSAGLADELAAVAPAADHATSARRLERAAALTPDPALRSSRLLAAARAAWHAGRPGWARLLLSRVDSAPGEVALLQGEIELRDGDAAVATHHLTTAAGLLPDPAAALLLAGEARRIRGDLGGYHRMAAACAPDPGPASAAPGARLLLAHFRGLVATFAGRHLDAAGALDEAVRAGLAVDDVAGAVWAAEAAFAGGHPERASECAAAAVSRARLRNRYAELPWALVYLSLSAIVLDRLACARAAARDGLTGPHNLRLEHLSLLGLAAALVGRRAPELAEVEAAAAEGGLGRPAAVAAWARACLDLAEDRPDDALGRLDNLAGGVCGHQSAIRVLATPQLVEAAVRVERPDRARADLDLFDRWTRAGGSSSWLALNHRCHALLATDPAPAEEHFRRAIDCHRRAGGNMELARTQLAYATLLRRGRRTRAAREQFRDALRGFEAAGATGHAERARDGLRAAGETVAAGRPALTGLTPQQAAITRLVAAGETNKEIARRLVISHRTVDHHLRNIFTALGVRSRVELARRVVATERPRPTS